METIDINVLHNQADTLAKRHGEVVEATTDRMGWAFMAVLDILVRTERADSLLHEVKPGWERRAVKVR
jgi:glutamyl/glutaminyl-tRNA synthetase